MTRRALRRALEDIRDEVAPDETDVYLRPVASFGDAPAPEYYSREEYIAEFGNRPEADGYPSLAELNRGVGLP